MKLIQRSFYLDKLKEVMGTSDIKVITGVRRSGKSKLMESFMAYVASADENANIIHINFNLGLHEHLMEYHALNQYIENAYADGKNNYVFIDEVQMCDGFEKAINSLHASEKYDIYITGSNAYFLSGELATLLSGRYVEYQLLPLSFAEYCQSKKAQGKTLAQNYREYVNTSSLPYTLNLNEPALLTDYLRGKHSINDAFTLDITNGVGTTQTDVRFLSDPEVVVYHLNSLAQEEIPQGDLETEPAVTEETQTELEETDIPEDTVEENTEEIQQEEETTQEESEEVQEEPAEEQSEDE